MRREIAAARARAAFCTATRTGLCLTGADFVEVDVGGALVEVVEVVVGGVVVVVVEVVVGVVLVVVGVVAVVVVVVAVVGGVLVVVVVVVDVPAAVVELELGNCATAEASAIVATLLPNARRNDAKSGALTSC